MSTAPVIAGIAHDVTEAKVTVQGVPDQAGVAAAIFRPLADAGINVDMIVQNVSEAGHTDISFTLPEDELKCAERILAGVVPRIDARGLASDRGIAKVSLIGAGMRSNPGSPPRCSACSLPRGSTSASSRPRRSGSPV